MSIDDVHREFFGVEQGELKGSSPERLTDLEAKVQLLASHLQGADISDVDRVKLGELSERISLTFPGSRLDTLFDQIIKGVVNPNTDLGALIHLPPPKPTVDDRVDRGLLAHWVDNHPPGSRETVQALAQQVRCVGQVEFEEAFGNGLAQFNQLLPKGAPYKVAVQPEKSNLWMAQLALSSGKLHTEPQGAVSLVYDQATCPEHLVLFDDASMSGEQLCRIIEQFASRSKEQQGPLKEITIVCAYMTNHALARLQEQITKPHFKGVQVDLIRGATLPTIAEAMRANPPSAASTTWSGNLDTIGEDEEWDAGSSAQSFENQSDKIVERNISTLNRIYRPKEKAKAGEKEMVMKRGELEGITSVLTPICFAHKLPDKHSFPEALTEGRIYSANGRWLPIVIKPLMKYSEPYKKGSTDSN